MKNENTALIQENAKQIGQLKTKNIPLIQQNTNMIAKLKIENIPLIEENTQQIDQLKTEIENTKTKYFSLPQQIEQNKNLIKQFEAEVTARYTPGDYWSYQI